MECHILNISIHTLLSESVCMWRSPSRTRFAARRRTGYPSRRMRAARARMGAGGRGCAVRRVVALRAGIPRMWGCRRRGCSLRHRVSVARRLTALMRASHFLGLVVRDLTGTALISYQQNIAADSQCRGARRRLAYLPPSVAMRCTLRVQNIRLPKRGLIIAISMVYP